MSGGVRADIDHTHNIFGGPGGTYWHVLRRTDAGSEQQLAYGAVVMRAAPQAEDRPIQIDVNQSDGTTPQTMTGWALTWELLDRENGTVLVTKTTGAGDITIGNGDGTNDRASFTLTDADIEGLS